jgi:hypothetical protein
MYDLQLSKPQIILYYKYKEFESNAEKKKKRCRNYIFIAYLWQNMIAQIKRASDLTPCPLKFFVRPEVLVKNQNKLMKKKSAIRLHNSSEKKHP